MSSASSTTTGTAAVRPPLGRFGLIAAALAALLCLTSAGAALLSLAVAFLPAQTAGFLPFFSPASHAARESPLPVEVLRRALAADPSNAKLASLLAAAERRAGAEDVAGRLTEAAAGLSAHETFAHFWLYSKALADGDGAGAVARLDTILRTDPNALASLMAAARLRRWPEPFAAALAGALAKRPPWRAALIGWLSEKEPVLDPAIRVAKAMSATDGPMTTPELAVLLSRLVAGGEPDVAYGFWEASLPDDRRAFLGPLFDPRFELEPLGGPFEWLAGTDPGVSLEFQLDPPHRGRVALIDVLLGQRPGPLLSQVVTLSPGPWRFSGKIALDKIDAGRGVRWMIGCIGGQTLGQDTPRTGDLTWESASFTFTVPASGCEAQLLSFSVFAPTTADSRLSGRIRIAELEMTPVR
jgi:hypothetical protein